MNCFTSMRTWIQSQHWHKKNGGLVLCACNPRKGETKTGLFDEPIWWPLDQWDPRSKTEQTNKQQKPQNKQINSNIKTKQKSKEVPEEWLTCCPLATMPMACTSMYMYTNRNVHMCTHIHGRDQISRSENPVPFLGFSLSWLQPCPVQVRTE